MLLLGVGVRPSLNDETNGKNKLQQCIKCAPTLSKADSTSMTVQAMSLQY